MVYEQSKSIGDVGHKTATDRRAGGDWVICRKEPDRVSLGFRPGPSSDWSFLRGSFTRNIAASEAAYMGSLTDSANHVLFYGIIGASIGWGLGIYLAVKRRTMTNETISTARRRGLSI